jgi:NADH dehydrogenase
MKRIIIVGGGFAGLKLAECLCKSPYEILLIDKLNHHQFQPLFYQVATAGLEPSSVSFPLRSIFHHAKNVRIRFTEVQQIIPAENKIVTPLESFSYDYLVIATGATTNFFGNKNLEEWAFPMKSTSEAINLRQQILLNFEEALYANGNDFDGVDEFCDCGGWAYRCGTLRGFG